MLEDVERLPRSISESEDWTPDWRNRQAMAYLADFRRQVASQSGNGCQDDAARALLRNVRFPDWEDDLIVRARFRHMAGAAVPGSEWTTAFDLGEQLISTNPETLEAASIKAWLLVSGTDEEIAARHSLTPFQVRVFHDTWFDVRGHLLERDGLQRVICGNPPAGDTAGWRQRELKMLWVALACGMETLDRLLVLKEDMSDEELEWLAETRRRARAAVKRSRAGGLGRVRPVGRLIVRG